MSKTITLREAQAAYSLSIEASQIAQGPILVEHEGRPIAVIVSIEEYQQSMAWAEHEPWRQEQLRRMESNRNAFRRLLPELLKTHEGQFVAIYQERMIDAHRHRATLVERIRAQGYRPVYIQKVTREPRVVELPAPE